jgi:hypothetical protein
VENTTDTPKVLSIDDAVKMMVTPEGDDAQETEVEESEEALEEAEVEDTDPDESDDSVDDDADIDDSEEDEYIDEDSEDADDADQDGPELITVKIDGEEVQVTLEDLKQGYSGQKYVQKGMQENAQMRKQMEELYAHFSAERQQLANLYQQMQSGALSAPPSPPSAALFDSDPIGYMEQKLKYDEAKAQYDEQAAQMNQVLQQQSEAQKAAMQAYAQQEMRQLLGAIPELSDANKATAIQKKLLAAGKALDYTPEEIAQVVDHRAIMALYKAAKYDEIMAGKDKAAKKTAGAKPVVKPGAKKVGDPTRKKVQRQQKARLRQSGSINDALALMFK